MINSRVSIEDTFTRLASGHPKVSDFYHTYILEPFSLTGSVPGLNKRWWEWSVDNYTRPTWVLNRNVNCYGHLYFVENDNDIIYMNYFHFLDFVMRKENPQYVLIWEVNAVKLRWDYMRSREYVNSFMDYRINIRINETTSEYNGYMMCVICTTSKAHPNLLSILTPNTDLPNLWKNLHTKHLRNHHWVYFYDWPYIKIYRFYDTGWARLEHVVADRFNISQLVLYNEHNRLRSNGSISSSLRNSGNEYTTLDVFVQNVMLKSRFPTYSISTAFWSAHEYQLITVAKRSLLSRIGWTAIFIPFETCIWVFILITTVWLCFIYTYISSVPIKQIVMRAASPLLERSYPASVTEPQTLLILWALVSFHLTILYGGDMVSSISALVPPVYL